LLLSSQKYNDKINESGSIVDTLRDSEVDEKARK
jgi:hypothetical protein